MATDNDITKALTVLAAAYPRFDLPEATIRIYQRLLADLDYDILKAATLQCATMCTFFPTVAEIRNAAVEIITMSEGIPSALEVWGEIVREIKRVSSSGRPTFSHPLVEQVVGEFNWVYLCTSENVISDRARVMDAYEKMVKKSLREKQMLGEVLAIVDKRLEARPQQAQLLPPVAKKNEVVDNNQYVPIPDADRERMNKLFTRVNAR